MCVHVCVCSFRVICVCGYVYRCVCMCMYVQVCMYMCVHVCMCVHVKDRDHPRLLFLKHQLPRYFETLSFAGLRLAN